MNRFILRFIVVAVAMCIPFMANAQFGKGIPGGKKYDTKKVDKLLKDIDALVAEYEEGTAQLWEGTEIVQNLVAQYKGGDFPILTKNWAVLKKAYKDAKNDAERTLVIKEREIYRGEMDKRAAAVEEFIKDPARKADLKGKITIPEKEQLQTVQKNISTLPEKDKAIIDRIPALVGQVPGLVADLTKQIAEDPLKAGDYQKMIDKLNKGAEKLQAIPGELEKQLKAVDVLLGVLGDLLN